MQDRDARSADLAWRKSRYSNPNGACVELAPLPDGGVAMRDSKDPDGAVLSYASTEMAGFVQAIKDGDFDDLI